MKKNGWKFIPLLLALVLAASFFGCSKDDENDNMPTVGTKTSVEQYTFDGISAPSTTAANTDTTGKSSSGGSYIGSGNSYLGGYQAASRLPTVASPNGGSGSSSTTKAGTTKKSLSNADLSSILGGFSGSLSMDNLGDIKSFLSQSGVNMDTAEIADFISGLVNAKENGEKPDAGNIVEGVLNGIGNAGG